MNTAGRRGAGEIKGGEKESKKFKKFEKEFAFARKNKK